MRLHLILTLQVIHITTPQFSDFLDLTFFRPSIELSVKANTKYTFTLLINLPITVYNESITKYK